MSNKSTYLFIKNEAYHSYNSGFFDFPHGMRSEKRKKYNKNHK